MGRQVISKTTNDDNVNKVKALIMNAKHRIFKITFDGRPSARQHLSDRGGPVSASGSRPGC
jgi:hypothetical protein